MTKKPIKLLLVYRTTETDVASSQGRRFFAVTSLMREGCFLFDRTRFNFSFQSSHVQVGW